VPRWLAWIVCALGAFLIVAGQHMWRAGRETRSYTRTRGRVVRAEVEEVPRVSEEGGTQFRPVVRYSFEARGRTYESGRIAIGAPAGPDTSDAQEARRLVERYPAGAEVDVWFDPRDPRRSVLVPGIPASDVVVAVVLGLALVGIGMFLLAR
jgi:hypothetical protein